jgi:hypothetical protein
LRGWHGVLGRMGLTGRALLLLLLLLLIDKQGGRARHWRVHGWSGGRGCAHGWSGGRGCTGRRRIRWTAGAGRERYRERCRGRRGRRGGERRCCGCCALGGKAQRPRRPPTNVHRAYNGSSNYSLWRCLAAQLSGHFYDTCSGMAWRDRRMSAIRARVIIFDADDLTCDSRRSLLHGGSDLGGIALWRG